MNTTKNIFSKEGLFDKNETLYFLILLLIADLMFISLHCIFILTPIQKNSLFYLGHDRGYAEFFQYIKMLWIIILLYFISIKVKSLRYVAWIILFKYLIIDDSLQIHERLGRLISNEINPIPLFGLRPQDFGELVVSALFGSFLLLLILLSYIKSNKNFKRSTKHLLFFLLALSFFGIFMDMATVTFNTLKTFKIFLGIIEDGGEMITISFVTWYVYLLNIHNGDIDLSIRR